jgi:hypothetical protein
VPLLYRRIALQGLAQMRALADVLLAYGLAQDSPARWTRSLSIAECDRAENLPGYLGALTVLLIHATDLVEFEMVTQDAAPMALSLLQHSGRSQITRLSFALNVKSPHLFILASRFHNLQELQLQLHQRDHTTTSFKKAAWTLPRLVDLRVEVDSHAVVRIDKEALLRFFSRCSFPGLRRFSWANIDHWADTDESEALGEFLRLQPSVTDLVLNVTENEVALPHAACARVTLIDPLWPGYVTKCSLSPRTTELVLDCNWEGNFEQSMPELWRLLDAILQQRREAHALRRIVIAKIGNEGSFGWLDERQSKDEAHMAEVLATYVPRFRRQGIGLLDGHGMELGVQNPSTQHRVAV